MALLALLAFKTIGIKGYYVLIMTYTREEPDV